MFKNELQQLFNGMPAQVQEKLKPVTDNLLERAAEVDRFEGEDPDYYAEERAEIMKEVNKVKYINDQWHRLFTNDN